MFLPPPFLCLANFRFMTKFYHQFSTILNFIKSHLFNYLLSKLILQFGGPYKEEESFKVEPWGWTTSVEEEQWSYMLRGRPTTIQIGYNESCIQTISFQTSHGSHEHKSDSEAKSTRKKVYLCINFYVILILI